MFSLYIYQLKYPPVKKDFTINEEIIQRVMPKQTVDISVGAYINLKI